MVPMTGARVRGDAAGGLDTTLAGEAVRLLAQRALWWPAGHTLFVADVHLGKAETFRARGVAVPEGPTAATLARLGALLDATGVRRLVVLGDLLHARAAQRPATLEPLRHWRRAHDALEVWLVRGNHDAAAGDPPADLRIEGVDEPCRLGPFALCHEPRGGAAVGRQPGYRLAGHLHPAVRLHGRARDSARLPCFRVGPHEAVLPAFGDFTGCAEVPRGIPGERLYAVAGARVFAIPAGAGATRPH